MAKAKRNPSITLGGVLVSAGMIAGGFAFEDPWLRPSWEMVGIVIATGTFVIWQMLGPIPGNLMALIGFMVLFPMPSTVRVVSIQNSMSGTVAVEVRSMDERRRNEKRLEQGETWNFKYYEGEIAPSEPVTVKVKVTVERTGEMGEGKVELDPKQYRSEVEITPEWFSGVAIESWPSGEGGADAAGVP